MESAISSSMNSTTPRFTKRFQRSELRPWLAYSVWAQTAQRWVQRSFPGLRTGHATGGRQAQAAVTSSERSIQDPWTALPRGRVAGAVLPVRAQTPVLQPLALDDWKVP